MLKLKIFTRIFPIISLSIVITLLPVAGLAQGEEEVVIDPALEAIQALEEKEGADVEVETDTTVDTIITPSEEPVEFGETIEIQATSEYEDTTPGEVSITKDVILVLDNSGSMKKNDPQFLTSKTVTEFINNLDEATRVAIVIFDQDVRIAVPLTEISPDTRDSILNSLDQINYKGLFTDSPAAIERAIYDLKQNARYDAKKVIIFMTDGIVDTGDTNRDLEKSRWLKDDLAADAADSEIKIFGIAFTEDADFELIQSLAQQTEGEYFRALTPEDLNGVFERVHTIINKQPEPVAVTPVVPVTPAPVVTPPEPVIIEVPAPAQPAISKDEEMRSTIIMVALLVLIIAVIVMVLMLIKGARSRGGKEEVAQEAFLNDINNYTSKATYKLGNKPTMLGRVAGKDTDHLNYIVIPETTIGRRHALIEYKDYSYWIVDQGSINGTFVNDQPVTSDTRLKHGDKVRLHRCEFEFLMPEDADAGMTVISNTVLAGQPARNEGKAAGARESAGIHVNESSFDEPDFDITGAIDEDDDEDSESPTEIKGTSGKGGDETIMLNEDNPVDMDDDDATIRPEDVKDDI